MNLSATLCFFKFLGNPALGLPHATVNTFKDIPVEISKILITANGGKPPDIRAIVLDKDNCFAKAKENVVYKPYEVCQIFMSEGYVFRAIVLHEPPCATPLNPSLMLTGSISPPPREILWTASLDRQ